MNLNVYDFKGIAVLKLWSLSWTNIGRYQYTLIQNRWRFIKAFLAPGECRFIYDSMVAIAIKLNANWQIPLMLNKNYRDYLRTILNQPRQVHCYFESTWINYWPYCIHQDNLRTILNQPSLTNDNIVSTKIILWLFWINLD